MKGLNRSLLLIVAAIAGGATIGAVGFGYPNNELFDVEVLSTKQPSQQPQSYIIQGAHAAYLVKAVENVGGNVSKEFPIINAISAVLTPSQAEKIKQLGNVRVQDDRRVMTMSLVSNAAVENGKSAIIDNYIAQQIEADRLHEMGITGNGVTVAVIDSGANLGGDIGEHLFRDSTGSPRVPVKYNAFLGDENHLYNDDNNGHGTHVTSIIANSLIADNGKFNSIAPDVNLLPIKAFDEHGESSYSTVLDALNWVFEHRYEYSIRVVNLSIGAEVESRYWLDPINQAVMRLWDAGIVVVTSAGNNGQDMGISVPGNTPYVITVGATTDNYTPFDPSDDRVTSFSSKGPTFEGFVKPELVAPGARIAVKMQKSLLYRTHRASQTGSNYSEISGTSQSSAVIAGVAALIIQNDPHITPDNVKCRLVATARAAKADGNLAYSPFKQGAGLVSAYAAVMSQATNCANQGLDIDKDLLGLKHYFGPVVKTSSGELQILLPTGDVLTEGSHWSEGDLTIEGAQWSQGDVGLEGAHWTQGDVGLLGAQWSSNMMGLEGAHWTQGTIGLEGAHWTEGEVALEGAHWTEGEFNLEGVHWQQGEIGLEGAISTEAYALEVMPIDPNIEIVIDESAWQ